MWRTKTRRQSPKLGSKSLTVLEIMPLYNFVNLLPHSNLINYTLLRITTHRLSTNFGSVSFTVIELICPLYIDLENIKFFSCCILNYSFHIQILWNSMLRTTIRRQSLNFGQFVNLFCFRNMSPFKFENCKAWAGHLCSSDKFESLEIDLDLSTFCKSYFVKS